MIFKKIVKRVTSGCKNCGLFGLKRSDLCSLQDCCHVAMRQLWIASMWMQQDFHGDNGSL